MKIKEFLTKQLEARKAELAKVKQSMVSEESAEVRGKLSNTVDTIEEEVRGLVEALNECEDRIDMRKANGSKDIDNDGMEYRQAFKQYIATGVMAEEFRADVTTKTTDVGQVIPQNLINRIIEKFEQLGVIYNMVSKTAYAVGQTIPVDGLKPVATWVGESETSDKQKKTLGASIVFSHFKLRCEISMSEEVTRMTLSAFEALFVKQVSDAMLRSIEGAIVSGAGTNSPKGILVETPEDGQKVEITKGDSITYEDLCNMEGALPIEKESNAKWCMTKKTFMSIMGIVDSNGQPIARVNYGLNGRPERYLLGREVVLYQAQANSKLATFSTTLDAGSIVAFIFDFGDYILNTNYDLGVQYKQDWDTEDHRVKSVLACDGKVIDKTSLVEMVVKEA